MINKNKFTLRSSIFIIVLIFYGLPTSAQSVILLEACNSIEDKNKRLICLKELKNFKYSDTSTDTSSRRVKNAFAAIAGAVNSGISFNNYSLMILEPAREIGIFKQEAPNANKKALELLEQSLSSYREAEKVWNASIYQSNDSGIFGRVLNPRATGLQNIVNKYKLPTRIVLFNDHLPVDSALPLIWRYAEERAKLAADILEGRITEAEIDVGSTTPETTVQCDKWGNPKDINGNPCKPF